MPRDLVEVATTEDLDAAETTKDLVAAALAAEADYLVPLGQCASHACW